MKTYEQLLRENEAYRRGCHEATQGINESRAQIREMSALITRSIFEDDEVFRTAMEPLISHASDEDLGRMVTGPDRDARPANCMSRKTARLAGIELAMRATGERKRVVHVPPEVKNARGLVELLRGATARGKAILPAGLPQERRAS